MDEIKLGVVDGKFADIVWDNAPITTGELVKRCSERLCWKRSTVYSALHKFCDNGIFKMENGVVDVVITREQLHARQSERFVNEVFGGSLPAFVAAFTRKKRLSEKEIAEIRKMIDNAKED